MDHNFATKSDLLALEEKVVTRLQKIDTEISGVRHELKAVEYKMTVKFSLMQAATVGLLAAIIKLF